MVSCLCLCCFGFAGCLPYYVNSVNSVDMLVFDLCIVVDCCVYVSVWLGDLWWFMVLFASLFGWLRCLRFRWFGCAGLWFARFGSCLVLFRLLGWFSGYWYWFIVLRLFGVITLVNSVGHCDTVYHCGVLVCLFGCLCFARLV